MPSVVKIDTILSDKISIRAIVVDGDKVYYGADKKRVGFKSLLDASKFERAISYDSLSFEFRSCAVTNNYVYFLNVGNPAVLYRFSKDLRLKEIVYTEKHEKAFYDSMQFWNDLDGIAVGDPTDNCMSIITTKDGGKTWKKTPCSQLPSIVDGEAAFAASNTNIVLKGNSVWIVSGGKKSRVFYSSDKGATWTYYETPIVQGEAMTGIFTADFYNEKILRNVSAEERVFNESNIGHDGFKFTVHDGFLFLKKLFIDKTILSQQSLDLMLNNDAELVSFTANERALLGAFLLKDAPNAASISHEGQSIGSAAYFGFYPGHNGIIIVCSNFGGAVSPLLYDAMFNRGGKEDCLLQSMEKAIF